MRISDWSSDVCSSDLMAAATSRRSIAATMSSTSLMLCSCRSRRDRETVRSWEEIGRASCRERVCQVRVDLGGRRIIKTKILTNDRTHKTKTQLYRQNVYDITTRLHHKDNNKQT